MAIARSGFQRTALYIGLGMGVTHTTDDYHGICGAFRICKSLYGKMVWHEFLSPKKMMLTDKAGTICFGGPMVEGVAAPQLSH